LIVAATLLFVFAFFFEPTLADLKTPVTLLAMIAISTGTLLHLFSTLRIKDAGVGIMTVIAILLGLTIAQASYRVVAQDPLDGPGPSFQDPLMDNLVGEWRLSREIRGRTVRTPSR
jgi:hypothetical protein